MHGPHEARADRSSHRSNLPIGPLTSPAPAVQLYARMYDHLSEQPERSSMLALAGQGIDLFNREIKVLRRLSPRRVLRRAPVWIDRASSRVSANVPVLEAVLGRLEPPLSLCRILARVVEIRE